MVETSLQDAQSQLAEGMALAKCRQCGCMNDTLQNLRTSLTALEDGLDERLLEQIDGWLGQMKPVKYACLGCAHCYPAVAGNALSSTLIQWDAAASPVCEFGVLSDLWPPAPGEYTVLCHGQDCPVAVSTLSSVSLADELASAKPSALCIVGKTETENIGIDKVVKNSITNPTIKYLILAGTDPRGHYPGATLLALKKNGVDENGRVIDAPGKRPILRNVSQAEVQAFRKQVDVIDMIGCDDSAQIIERIQQLVQDETPTCGCADCSQEVQFDVLVQPVHVVAQPPRHIEMDRAGYFVILPDSEKQRIVVEHYNYDNVLLHVIEGEEARSIYWTIIENGWVSQLSHAAYIGKELSRAEQAMAGKLQFVQDGA
jgi:tetrahydromethanopterin S-methyltransferase subunit A